MKKYKVTKNAMRPASKEKKCFYCQEPIGGNHKDDCVTIRKNVLIKVTLEYKITVPNSWDKNDVEFSRSESSWCADNIISELEKEAEKNCLCGIATTEYIKDTSDDFLDEG